MQTPRRLQFTVGTSLLTASLVAGPVGCEKNQPPTDEPHVNEGPEPVIANPAPEPEPDAGEQPEPGPASNPGPVDVEPE